MDPKRIRDALDSLIYLPSLKEKAIQPSIPEPVCQAQGASASNGGPRRALQCRPWDRGDIFRRLHTFKPSTWFCKPSRVGPVPCARRGWANTALDRLTCECCGSTLSFPLAPSVGWEDADEALVPPGKVRSRRAGAQAAKALEGRLTSGHVAACPWRRSTCDASVAQFVPLAPEAVAAGFAQRCAALCKLDRLPPLAPAAHQRIAATHRAQLEALLRDGPQDAPPALPDTLPPTPRANGDAGPPAAPAAAAAKAPQSAPAQDAPGISGNGTPAFAHRVRMLALCGWEVRAFPTKRKRDAAGASRPPGAAQAGKPAAHTAPTVLRNAEEAAIVCATCGARMGVWYYLRPSAGALRMPGASAAAPAAATDFGAQGTPTAGQLTAAPALPAPLPHARIDLTATIAGGPLAPPAGGGVPGPFGHGLPSESLFNASPSAPVPRPFGHPPALGQGLIKLMPPAVTCVPGPFGRPRGSQGLFNASPPAPAASGAGSGPAHAEQAASQANPGTVPFAALAPASAPLHGQGSAAQLPPAVGTVPGATDAGPQCSWQEPAGSSPRGPFGSVAATRPAFGGPPETPAGRKGAFGGEQDGIVPAFLCTPQPVAAQLPALAVRGGSARLTIGAPGLDRPELPSKRARTGPEPAPPAPSAQLIAPAAEPGVPQPAQPHALAGGQLDGPLASLRPATMRVPGQEAQRPAAHSPPAEPLDPLSGHRPFCPWVASSGSEGGPGRIGWQWCLEVLVPGGRLDEGEGLGSEARGPTDPAAKLRSLLQARWS